MELSARRPPAAATETISDRDIPVEGEKHMADVAAGAALGTERSSSPAVGTYGAARPVDPPAASPRADTPTPLHTASMPAATDALGTHPAGSLAAPDLAAAPAIDQPVAASAATPERGPEPAVAHGCTQAQLRRFIKSRPYVPMHELRRRFELNGVADDVSPIRVADGIVYVGLGARESDFIADLVRQGDIGVELCHDPPVPMVVGVYAMRPISR
jgi:hypothetical protein